MKPLCIYHANCLDGFGAAWVVRRALGGDVDFHAGVYQEPPPDVRGRDVIIVDFSYKRAVLEVMADQARKILILDHHKTAAEDLGGFLHAPLSFGAWQTLGNPHPLSQQAPICVLFDMERSGAGIAWDYFNPGTARPELIARIEDGDLWRFRFADTRAVQACILSYSYDFEEWDRLFEMDTTTLRIEGGVIERKHHKDIAELLSVVKRDMLMGGYLIPVANLPHTFTSDAGHLMANGSPYCMAACYWDTRAGRVFSLRSTDEGPDVSATAKRYGGGGHAHAAGFHMPIGWEGDTTGGVDG